MFAWLRKCWWGGQVPPKPDEDDLDWPDEEEWAFNYADWQWQKKVKEPNPYDDGWAEKWDDVQANRPVNLDDIPMAEVIEDEPKCCGGSCKLPPPLPPPNDPIWTAPPHVNH